MEYELINPSDPYTFITDSRETAVLTVFLLGTGYGAKPKEGNEDIPIFLFGGSREWYIKEFGRTPDEGLVKKQPEVAEALKSFMYGCFDDREMYQAALDAITDEEKKEDFIQKWQDRRSSLNDIGTYAHKLGKKLSLKPSDKDSDPAEA